MTERRSPSFQPSSLEAIRELRKTQTRRVLPRCRGRIGDRDTSSEPGDIVLRMIGGGKDWPFVLRESRGWGKRMAGELTPHKMRPRYGEPGTVWALCEPLRRHKTNIAVYLDGTMAIDRRPDTRHVDISWEWNRDTLSAMFMPRWAARDFVTLEDVRVERLQNISDEDAIAEGITVPDTPKCWYRDGCNGGQDCGAHMAMDFTPQDAFAALWDSINGKKVPWKADPWVTAYTFGNYQRDPGRVMQENKP